MGRLVMNHVGQEIETSYRTRFFVAWIGLLSACVCPYYFDLATMTGGLSRHMIFVLMGESDVGSV